METSSVYESEPFGVNEDQPLYLNMVLAFRTPLKPMQLLGNLLEIERANGRVRNRPKQSRTLDLDILMLDQITLVAPDLVIPHPRMHERSFVMFPLAEIAPHAMHPTLNLTVAEIADGLPNQAIRRLGALDSLTQSRDR